MTKSNRENAEALSKLILENPDMQVVAWIGGTGMHEGQIDIPRIQEIAYSDVHKQYIKRDGDFLEDCLNFYGDIAESWTEDELKIYAHTIPWRKVIAVRAYRIRKT